MHDKPVINMSTTVSPGESTTITETFDTDGFVTHLHARAYPGEETSVERYFRLWVGGKDEGNPIPLVRSPNGSREPLTGDDETWSLDMRRPVTEDDVIEAKYVNTGNYSYPVTTIVTVEQERSLIDQLVGGGIL